MSEKIITTTIKNDCLPQSIELQDCQKVNFIYGANGSGKSTISGFLQNPHDSKYHDSSIIWEKGETSDIRVYNRRFRDGNLQKDAIDGIFTIGEDTIRDREKVRELKEQREQKEKGRDKCKESLEKICKQKENLITSFRDTVWNVILKHNEHIFKSAFSGLRNNKEKFRDEVIRRYRINHHSSYTQEQLEERAQTLFTEQRPVKCPVLELPDADSIRVITEIETNEIWGKVIVGNADSHISVVSLQNTMRRILENYFGMLGKRRDSYITGSFSTLEEQMLCRSLLYWINDGSHSIPDDIQIDNTFESVENYKKIFKDIFYNTGNADHYDMMMGVVEETVSK